MEPSLVCVRYGLELLTQSALSLCRGMNYSLSGSLYEHIYVL